MLRPSARAAERRRRVGACAASVGRCRGPLARRTSARLAGGRLKGSRRNATGAVALTGLRGDREQAAPAVRLRQHFPWVAPAREGGWDDSLPRFHLREAVSRADEQFAEQIAGAPRLFGGTCVRRCGQRRAEGIVPSLHLPAGAEAPEQFRYSLIHWCSRLMSGSFAPMPS